MPTTQPKISLMAPATLPLSGNELLEIVQGGGNYKVTPQALMQTLIYGTSTPVSPGTITDLVLPGTGNYFIDIDTTVGVIEIDGTVSQRDGQRVRYGNKGTNNLQLGVGAGHGSAGNQLRANAGPIVVAPGDCITIEYCNVLGYWVVA